MNQISDLLQGSPEWSNWRLKGTGASEIASIVGLSPYTNGTPYNVWLDKTGRVKGFEGNSFTQHGQETEAKARARYELKTMEDMPPACATHPKYDICRASLDGLRADNKLILELKCPTGRDTIDAALSGQVPDHYMAQIQFQLAVTGADECHFFVYHEESGDDALVSVFPNIEYQGRLIAAALDFWERYVLTDTPPPLTDKDVKYIENHPVIQRLCQRLFTDSEHMAKKDLDLLKKEIVTLSEHTKMRCPLAKGYVQISTVNRKGVFSYHKLTVHREEAS